MHSIAKVFEVDKFPGSLLICENESICGLYLISIKYILIVFELRKFLIIDAQKLIFVKLNFHFFLVDKRYYLFWIILYISISSIKLIISAVHQWLTNGSVNPVFGSIWRFTPIWTKTWIVNSDINQTPTSWR